MYSNHKMLKHLDKLFMWAEKGYTFPIMVDFDLTNACNHKCPLCNGAKVKGGATVPFETARKLIDQFQELGVKAVALGGGGEPTCHPDLAKILKHIKSKGMEVSVTTNAYMVNEEVLDAIVSCCTWVRLSLDADGPEIYQKTHGMDADAFYKALDNFKKIVNKKQISKSEVLLGVSYLIGAHTIAGAYNGTKLSKDIGVDYIRLRPFFNRYDGISFSDEDKGSIERELDRCRELEDDNFLVSIPEARCKSALEGSIKRRYDLCYIPHFAVSITADLKLYPCCNYKDDESHCLGDLSKDDFVSVWLSEKRKRVEHMINLKNCPNPCQWEKHNELLWDIKHPIMHSNFL